MSIDKSLKSASTLARHRNVLTRAERIRVLQETDRWPEDAKALGLPKIANRKVSVGKKTKKKEEESSTEAVEEEKKP